jgi:hypothetical protein
MSYRNKTYVAFASEDILHYRMMQAWKKNEHIDFDFFDAHDIYQARDTSKPDTIKARLTERLKNAKQVVLLGSGDAKRKGSDGNSFLAHEVEVISRLKLPVIVVNLNQERVGNLSFIPDPLLNSKHYLMAVSYQPKIIQYAMDNYAAEFSGSTNQGVWIYKPEVYSRLGL